MNSNGDACSDYGVSPTVLAWRTRWTLLSAKRSSWEGNVLDEMHKVNVDGAGVDPIRAQPDPLFDSGHTQYKIEAALSRQMCWFLSTVNRMTGFSETSSNDSKPGTLRATRLMALGAEG